MYLSFQWASVTHPGYRHVRAGMLEISRKIHYVHSFSNFPLMSFQDCPILGIKVRQGPGNNGPDQFHGNPEHTVSGITIVSQSPEQVQRPAPPG